MSSSSADSPVRRSRSRRTLAPCDNMCLAVAADRIDRFPYRRVGEDLIYCSPTFGGELRPYGLRHSRGATYVQVEGIPDVRMVRRDDWGWQLKNAMQHAENDRFWRRTAGHHGLLRLHLKA